MRVFLPSIALACLLWPGISNAEVLAVCGAADAASTASYGSAAILQALKPNRAAGSQLALWHDAKGFDVLLNWGAQDQVSLRAKGAEIMGNELGDDLVHVVVAREGANSLEHFLLSWDDPSVGRLIWNAPSGEGGDDVLSYEMACIRPKH